MTDQSKSADARDEGVPYEPPTVEDLDSGRGPVETAAGALPPSINPAAAAPREL
jgi:hypothetical protein